MRSIIGRIRGAVRAGGYMVIDDGFLAKSARLAEPGYEHYVDHAEARRQLVSHGDNLVREVVIPGEDVAADNRVMTELIRRRAEDLARRHPDVADLILGYVERQEHECRLLETEFVACDQVPWSLFGISIAGYNALASLLLAGLSFWSALAMGQQERRSLPA